MSTDTRLKSDFREEDHPRADDGRFGEGRGSARNDGEDSASASDAARDYRENGTKSRAFKAWFGDWESDPENASKIVDDEGKPLRVYHGTPEVFEAFDESASVGLGAEREGGIFFTSSPEVAEAYSYHASLESKRQTAEVSRLEEELDDLYHEYGERAETSVPESSKARARFLNDILDEGHITREEYDKIGRLEDRLYDLRDALPTADEEYEDKRSPNTIPAYLNIRNPKIIDAGGMGWDLVVPHHLSSVDREKHDGIIFKNIRDTGTEEDIIAITYVIFTSSQAKSIHNRGTFDPQESSLRKSLMLRTRLKSLIGVLRGRLKDTTWREGDHPRADDGKFGEGGGGSTSTAAPAPPKKPAKQPASPHVFPDRKPRTRDIYPADEQLPPQFQESVSHLDDTQRAALKMYSTAAYIDMNRALRTGATIKPERELAIKEIQKAFAAAPPFKQPVTAWRGLTLEGEKRTQFMAGIEKALKDKGEVEMRGFVSTSINPGQAASFGTDAILEIRANKGLYLGDLAENKTERELLLDHGSRFRVLGIKEIPFGTSGGKRKVIQLEQVAGGEQKQFVGWRHMKAADGDTDAGGRFAASDLDEFVFHEATTKRLKGDFREEDHPRAADGKFGEGGGGESESSPVASAKPSAKPASAPYNERGSEQAAKHFRTMQTLLVKFSRGAIDNEELAELTKKHTRKTLTFNDELFAELHNRLYERIEDEYGREALASPEWKTLKYAIEDAKLYTDRLIKSMGKIGLEYARGDSEDRTIRQEDRDDLREMSDSLVEAYDSSVHRIVDAFEALMAKHGRGKLLHVPFLKSSAPHRLKQLLARLKAMRGSHARR